VRDGERASTHKGRIIRQARKIMTYITDFEAQLTKKLLSDETAESIVRWVSEEILKSYRNGIKAGKNGADVKRDGKSRRPFPPQTR
jgi:hypothetical protein